MRKQKKEGIMKLTDFYDQVNYKLTKDELFKRNHTLKLDKMDTSSVAVYQTMRNNEGDDIKKEVCSIVCRVIVLR